MGTGLSIEQRAEIEKRLKPVLVPAGKDITPPACYKFAFVLDTSFDKISMTSVHST